MNDLCTMGLSKSIKIACDCNDERIQIQRISSNAFITILFEYKSTIIKAHFV